MRSYRIGILVGICLLTTTSLTHAQPAKDDPLATIRFNADRVKSSNNLKQIGIAFHFNHDAHGFFPGNIVDKDGKPLLSWRVAILPYIEEQELYNKFKLDEPWDSDNNKPLLEKMPKVYTAPRGKFEKGHTFYQSFSGPGTVMGAKKLKLSGVADGLSKTFMVVEAGEAVPWSKPADIEVDPKKPLPALGGIFDGPFNVGFGDASVRFLKKGIKEENLRKYITVAGGEETKESDLVP